MFTKYGACDPLDEYASLNIRDIIRTHAQNVQKYSECAKQLEELVLEAKTCETKKGP